LTWAIIIACMSINLPGAFGQSGHLHATAANPGAAGSKSAPETYEVVEIGTEIRVVSKSGLNALKKQYDDSYKSDTKKYLDAKKTSHDANGMKKPDKKDYTVKPLKSNFKTQEEAQKFANDKIEEREQGGKKTPNNW
jgi:hypothetical protein